MNHKTDHALTTINCTLDSMASVLKMLMEVESANRDVIGYLIISCFSDIRKHCVVIEAETNVDSADTAI